jgi:hypothetical protein
MAGRYRRIDCRAAAVCRRRILSGRQSAENFTASAAAGEIIAAENQPRLSTPLKKLNESFQFFLK